MSEPVAIGRWQQDPTLRAEVTARLTSGEHSYLDVQRYLIEQGFPNITPGILRRWASDNAVRHSKPSAKASVATPSTDAEVDASISRHNDREAEKFTRNRLRELTGEAAKFRQFLEMVKSCAFAIPMPTVPMPDPAPCNQGTGEERVVLVVVSDVQAGIYVSSEEVGDRLAYNSTLLQGRWDYWETQIFQWIDEQRLIGPVVGIEIGVPGDLVENHQLRIGARKRTDMGTASAAIVFQRMFAATIHRLRLRYPEIPIEVDIVPGNHDRIGGGKQGDETTGESWTVIIGEFLDVQFSNDPMVQIHNSRREGVLIQIGRSRIFLHHGHGIQGTAMLPWYGIDRKVGRWEGYLRQHLDYVILGHFHNYASWQTNSGCLVLVNGAWFSTTSFGTQLGLANEANQLVFAFTEHGGMVSQRQILLVDRIPAEIAEGRFVELFSAA